jgi:HK97 family phage major capsid protein
MSDDIMTKAAESIDGLQRAFEQFKQAQVDNQKQRDIVTEQKMDGLQAEVLRLQGVADQAANAALMMQRSHSAGAMAGGDDAGGIEAKATAWNALHRIYMPNSSWTMDGAQYEIAAKALPKYLRRGDKQLEAEEIKALSAGSDPNGGYLVRPDMSDRIVQQVYQTSPMRAYATVVQTGTDKYVGIYDLGEFAYGWVGETQSRLETATSDLGEFEINIHEIAAMPMASQKMLDDSFFNVETWVQDKLSTLFARAENTAFVTGNGIKKPRGFLGYPEGTTNPGQIQAINTGANGAFNAADPISTLRNVVHSGLKAEYRPNASWFMNSATVGQIMNLKDADGKSLWQPSMQAGVPSTLLGYSVASFEDMPDIATGSLSIAFGDMRQAYTIVDRSGIGIIRDVLTTKGYVKFYATKRTGGAVVNFEAIKLIKFAA